MFDNRRLTDDNLFVAIGVVLLACSSCWGQCEPRAVPSDHLHNGWQLSDRIFSGSEPKDVAAMMELSRLGVGTIVSVDGIAPNLKLAEKFGLRYVHVPIGYDGVDTKAGQTLARVARDISGKIYIHCHHGKHRGPAAAAILCRADDGRSAAQALSILHKAGTGKEYPGLWRDVETYQVPSQSAQLPPLVERAEVASLAEAMAKLDRIFDRLKLSSASAWQPMASHPEFSPLLESVQLDELFAEAARAAPTGDLRNQLAASSQLARDLSRSLGHAAIDTVAADTLLAKLNSNCTSCHRRYRNEPDSR